MLPPGRGSARIGVVAVAAVPLADHRERLAAAAERAEKNVTVTVMARVQVGIAVIADRVSPVAVDGGQVVVEVAVPAAALGSHRCTAW